MNLQHAFELKPDGALIAGDSVSIESKVVDNASGTIKSTTATMIEAKDIFNKGGSISSGGELKLAASHDIDNTSGSISGKRVSLSAGNDIINRTATATLSFGNSNLGGSLTLAGAQGSITATDSLIINALNNLVSRPNVQRSFSARFALNFFKKF